MRANIRRIVRLAERLWLVSGLPDAAARDGVLRDLLAAECGAAPATLRLEREEGGRPRLSPPWTELHFSLARRADMMLVATGWDTPVGADLEPLPHDPEGRFGQDVAEQFFAAGEAAWLRSLPAPHRTEGFLRLWTAKEAVLKALGIGIIGGIAEPDLTPYLVPGRPLAAPSVATEAEGMRFTVEWWRAEPPNGPILAARASGVPAGAMGEGKPAVNPAGATTDRHRTTRPPIPADTPASWEA